MTLAGDRDLAMADFSNRLNQKPLPSSISGAWKEE
jgi:hypothetical protein